MSYNSDYLSGPLRHGGKGNPQEWVYDTVDLVATVIGSGHISDAEMRGFQVGDKVTIRKFDSLTLRTNPSISLHQVTAVSSSGATLSAAYGSASGLTVPVVSSNSTPAVGDDIADAYAVGSLWIELDADDAYVLTDASTGAAIWKPLVDRFALTFNGYDLDSDTAIGVSTTTLSLPVPVNAKLISAFAVLDGGVSLTATATITLSRNSTAITNGVIVFGSTAGDGTVASCGPTAANLFSAGDRLEGALAHTGTGAVFSNLVFYFERTT